MHNPSQDGWRRRGVAVVPTGKKPADGGKTTKPNDTKKPEKRGPADTGKKGK